VWSEEVSEAEEAGLTGVEINAAAQAIKQWGKKLEGVIRAAEVLERVGSLSNAADEANARIAAAQGKETALVERLAQLQAELNGAEATLGSLADVNRQLDAATASLVEIEGKLAAAQARRDALASETADLEGRADAARAALAQLQASFAGERRV
jgi:chromosome segregation ATPase